MSIETAVLIKLPFPQLLWKLDVKADADHRFTGADGGALQARPIDDATVVFTDLPFDAEPDQIAAALRMMLGDALDMQKESRGLFVFPKAAAPKSGTYDAAIADIGELGTWVKKLSRAEAEALAQTDLPDGAAAMLGSLPAGFDMGAFQAQAMELFAAMPGDVMSTLQSAMMSGDPKAMEEAQRKLAESLQSSGNMAEIERRFAGVMEAMGPDAMAQMQQMADDPSVLNAARELEELKTKDPARYAEYEKMLLQQAGAEAPKK